MKKKPQRVDPLSPGHHTCETPFGTPYGYTVRADGSIELAPGMVAPILAAHERRRGLEALLNATNAFVAKEMEQVEKATDDFWHDLNTAIPALKLHDLDSSERWSLDHRSRVLRRAPKKPAVVGEAGNG